MVNENIKIMETNIQTIQPIFQKIHEIRGFRVMLDFELAELYGVETKQLNLSVKRNLKRFPADFMFQLTQQEHNSILRFQIETSRWQLVENEKQNALRFQFETLKLHGGKRYLPYAFTEQGVAMLSGILNSDRAISVNIAIMRAFVEIRRFISGGALKYPEIEDLRHRIQLLEKYNQQSVQDIEEHQKAIAELYTLLTEMVNQKKLNEESKRRPIGFK